MRLKTIFQVLHRAETSTFAKFVSIRNLSSFSRIHLHTNNAWKYYAQRNKFFSVQTSCRRLHKGTSRHLTKCVTRANNSVLNNHACEWNTCRHASRDSKFRIKDELLWKYAKSLHDQYKGLYESNELDRTKGQYEKHALAAIFKLYEEYVQKSQDRLELEKMIDGMSTEDDELRTMVQEEKEDLKQQIEAIKLQLVELFIPEEKIDENDVILEVSAGVGGEEAMLFTRQILDMYQNFAVHKGWNFEVLEQDIKISQGGAAALAHGSASISGEGVYRVMKYECGVHRVQRVPITETRGRIHTSTMTVAILPQPKEIDFELDKKDLKIESFQCSGAGGQSVNTSNSAVRITHIPTGLKTECRDERTQSRNLVIGMKRIRAKVYQHELEKQISSSERQRKIQVGTAARSEKIRTYNFKDNRVTDHRIHHSMFGLDRFLFGEEELAEMIETVMVSSRQEMLAEILENFEKNDENSATKYN